MRIYRPQVTRGIPDDATIDRVKGVVTYKARGKTRRAVLTVTDRGDRMRLESSTWRIEFRDHLGRRQNLTAFPHEGQTRFLASRIEELTAYSGEPIPAALREYFGRLPSGIVSVLQECGLLESEPALAKPLGELVGMYEQALCARERSAGHVKETVRMIREVFDACGFESWRQIKDAKVEAYLRDLREGERHVSYRRSNAYLTACQSFANWIVNDRAWAPESPLRRLKRLSDKEAPRHTRRALGIEELRTLLRKTAEGPERYGMTGRERYLLYRLAIETGLRRGEIRRLQKGDFDLDAGTVTVRAVRATKNKRTREQALSPGLCAELREFLSSKLPAVKAFGGSYVQLTDRTADMLREDLDAAGLPYKDDRGNVFDFHSLRVETASLLIAAGVDPKQAQEIMRHSTIGLTMDTYARVLGDKRKAAAVAALPDLSLPESQRQAVVRTGTDDLPAAVGSAHTSSDGSAEMLLKCCAQDGKGWIASGKMKQTNRVPDIENAVLNEAEGSRTLNLRIDSPML